MSLTPSHPVTPSPSPPIPIYARMLEPVLRISAPATTLLLYVAVLVSPLLGEGIAAVPRGVIEIILTCLVGIWLVGRSASPVAAPLELAGPMLLFGILTTTLVAQLVPLPTSMFSHLGPHHTFVVETFGSTAAWLSASLNPSETFTHLVRISLLFGVFCIARDRLRRLDQRLTLLNLLLLGGCLQVLVGVGSFWMEPLRSASTTVYEQFGTFVSPNRTAAYFNLLLPIALSLAIDHYIRFRNTEGDDSHSHDIARGILDWRLYMLAALCIAVGLVFCRSRLAWSLFPFSIIGLALWYFVGQKKPGLAGLIGCCVIAVGGSLGYLARDSLLQQLAVLSDKTHPFIRPDIWRATLDLARDHMLLGVGMGSFATAFGAYTPLEAPVTVRFAESVWLETLAELGISGLVLMLGACFVVGWRFWKHRSWELRLGRLALPGMMIGFGTVLLHAAGDLIFRGYAMGITVAAISGMAIASLEDPPATRMDPAFRYGVAPRRTFLLLLLIPLVVALVLATMLSRLAVERAGEEMARSPSESTLRLLARAEKIAPIFPGPPLWLGSAALEKADLALKRAATLEPEEAGASELWDQAVTTLALADTYLEQSIRRSPLAGTAQRLRSRVAQLAGFTDLSVTYARQACRVQRGDYRNWYQLGSMLAATGRTDKSLEALHFALRRAPDAAIDGIVSQLFRQAAGQSERVETGLAPSGSLLIPYAMGRYLDKQGRYAEAMRWYDRFLASPGDHREPIQSIAWTGLLHEDLERAERAGELLKTVEPELSSGYALLAEVYQKRGDTDQALVMLETAARYDRPPTARQIRAIQMLQEAGRSEDAKARLESLRRAFPRDPAVFSVYAFFLSRTGNWIDALKTLNEAKRMHPDRQDLRIQLVNLLRSHDLAYEAQDELLECLKLPAPTLCLIAATRFARDDGDLARAEQWCTAALKHEPQNASAQALLGQLALDRGDRAKAGALFSRAIINDPTNKDVVALKRALQSAD